MAENKTPSGTSGKTRPESRGKTVQQTKQRAGVLEKEASADYRESAFFEHRFWLQVMGDHARFIFGTLGPLEQAEIRQAAMYRDAYDALLADARRLEGREEREEGVPADVAANSGGVSGGSQDAAGRTGAVPGNPAMQGGGTADLAHGAEAGWGGAMPAMERPQHLASLNQAAWRLTESFREFKLHLIRRHLEGKLQIGLTPSFINHMVNELEEYQRVLKSLLSGQPVPLYHPVHYHLLWLLDGYGHASSIASEMDFVEHDMIMTSRRFADQFKAYYLKAVEMAGFLRTHCDKFPALARFNKQAELEMLLFQQFLRELEEMELKAEVLSTFTPLMADHMFREECYYLTKLAQVSETNRPDCDPGKPRIEM